MRMNSLQENVKFVAREVGHFSRELLPFFEENTIEMKQYLKNIKKYINNILLEHNKNKIQRNFEKIFLQVFVYLSITVFLRVISGSEEISSIKNHFLMKKFGNKYYLNENYKIIINIELNLPNCFINNFIIPLENLLIKNRNLFFTIKEEFIYSEFYSLFLKNFDPITAKNLGVIFTPIEIVQFMTSGVLIFLRDLFNKDVIEFYNTLEYEKINKDFKSGLKILEPAAGTMSFILGLIRLMNENLNDEIRKKFLLDILIKDIRAVEILVTPYLIGFININYFFNEVFKNHTESKLKIREIIQNSLFSMNTLSIENEILWLNDSKNIEKNDEIQIIIGNPPYNLDSQNITPWIQNLINDYKENLNEKNLKILSDDYVKFIRFSQWKIRKSGKGMLVFITNNNFLDGSVFIQMRKSLVSTFNKIYIINLHGNIRKGEKSNPFNIQVGVCIFFMIRTEKLFFLTENQLNDLDYVNKKVDLFYYDVPENNITEKYKKLKKNSHFKDFKKIKIIKSYFFLPKDNKKENRYNSFVPISDFFINKPKSGIMTGRDALGYGIYKNHFSNSKFRIIFFNKKFDELK
jgi:predicted helicase